MNILSATSRIETPFIAVTIGEYTFGVFNKEKGTGEYINAYKYYYPNYVYNLSIVKVNGAVNTYTLQLKYQITAGDDPNFFEKVFSANSKSRRIIISYGDYSSPTFLYKEEAATITDIKSSIDFSSSSITYTITAISDALSLKAGTYCFPERKAKPSSVLFELLYSSKYGLLDIFYGMRDRSKVLQKALVASDDKAVTISAKNGITVFDYVSYLVSCMTYENKKSTVGSSTYHLIVNDDYSGELGGPYFQVIRVDNSYKKNTSLDVYEIDIGYPNVDIVTSFSIDDDQTYSILYEYSQKIEQPQYNYRIDDSGKITEVYSPSITTNKVDFHTSQSDKNWWTQVTQYPIKATLTIKGLLRAATLMSFVKVNTYFFGQKHLSSGLYIITKQTDSISSSGYRTTLNLTRISGDDLW